MGYEEAMDALGDPTRREIVEVLRAGPRTVGDLASLLPVSRPAVSKHLRILKQAGLVSDHPEGTRRIYRLDPEGLGAAVAHWEGLWTEALVQFKEHAERRRDR